MWKRRTSSLILVSVRLLSGSPIYARAPHDSTRERPKPRGKQKAPPVHDAQAGLLEIGDLCLTQNAVDLCATHWADALCHAATRIRDLDVSFEGTLLFALYAVGLTLVFLSHNDPPIAVRSNREAPV